MALGVLVQGERVKEYLQRMEDFCVTHVLRQKNWMRDGMGSLAMRMTDVCLLFIVREAMMKAKKVDLIVGIYAVNTKGTFGSL
ncbi:hypothetical protein PVK06_009071 [Gossypium arboreum]|uniref:Uncharacterized protein n=1 Tax=Gossypium arboreum TaxID=29729 RepID=A0ABR0QMC3_GOSAR|nr:hypothetical protein PVK06_009071 [Gossypium arboreum]